MLSKSMSMLVWKVKQNWRQLTDLCDLVVIGFFFFSYLFKLIWALKIPGRWGQTPFLQLWACYCWNYTQAGMGLRTNNHISKFLLSKKQTKKNKTTKLLQKISEFFVMRHSCDMFAGYHGNTLFLLLPQLREKPQNLLHFSQEPRKQVNNNSKKKNKTSTEQ